MDPRGSLRIDQQIVGGRVAIGQLCRRFHRHRAAPHLARAQPVDRAVARKGCQPRDRAGALRVVAGGIAPEGDVNVLQGVFGFFPVPQDTQANPEKLHAGEAIDHFEGIPVALRQAEHGRLQLLAAFWAGRCHCGEAEDWWFKSSLTVTMSYPRSCNWARMIGRASRAVALPRYIGWIRMIDPGRTRSTMSRA